MKGSIYILLGGISYGLLSSFVKRAYAHGYLVNDVVGVQMLLGTFILWVLYLLLKKSDKKKGVTYEKFKQKDIILLLTCGSVTGLTGLLYYTSLSTIPASVAVILLFQFTWIGVVIEAVFFKKKPGKEKLLSLIPLIIGTIIASNVFSSEIVLDFKGVFFGILSAISYSVFIIVSGQIAPKSNPIAKSATMITGGLVLCAIIAFPTFYTNFAHFIDIAKHSGFYLAMFGPVISTVMFAKGTPLVGGGMASLLGAIELPTVIVSSYLFLHEQITILQLIGVALILLAIAYPILVKEETKMYTCK
ncbi:MAG: DMT family transporter [Erysipelotrichales bacterium]